MAVPTDRRLGWLHQPSFKAGRSDPRGAGLVEPTQPPVYAPRHPRPSRGKCRPQGRIRTHQRGVSRGPRRPAGRVGAAAVTAAIPTPPPAWERPWPFPQIVGWVGFINPASRPGDRTRGVLGWWSQPSLRSMHPDTPARPEGLLAASIAPARATSRLAT